MNSSDSSGSLSEIFPYKEAFSPYLLSTLAQKYHCNTESLFDPFCGVGSSFMDYSIKQCYGFDTNPLAFHIAKAKLEKLDSKNLQKARDIVKNFRYQENMFALQDSVPKSHTESRSIKNLRLDSVYKLPQWESFGKYANAEKYTTIMHFIESFKELDSKTYHFIKYLVIANLSAMLDYKRDGNGIKYRESKITDSVDYLKELTLRALEIKERFDSTNQKILHVRNESCIHQNFYKILESQIDCILTSPPYANLFDYFEIYKMELWASGLVKSYEEWRELQAWVLPKDLIKKLNPCSLSGGLFVGDVLYCTGHDAAECYVLALPQKGSTLKWLRTYPVPFPGQAISMDEQGNLWGIDRANDMIIKATFMPE